MEIRTASPNDNGDISQLMYSSGIELYDFIFKTSDKTAIDFIHYEFLSGQGFCGYPNVTVAVNDQRVVATGCFFDGKIFNNLVWGTVKNIFSFYGPIKAFSVLARTRHTSSVMRTPKKTEIYLSNFGVDPNLRGTGIGSKMIEHQRNIAEKDGYDTLSLDVADNNPRAESLYTRLGFTIVREKVFPKKAANIPLTKEMKMAL